MVEQPIRVSVQIAGQDVPAGRLWSHRRGRSETATFGYLPDYLARQDAYELDPRRISCTRSRDGPEEHSPHAAADLHELWRRIVFDVLISNTDDYLRNHGLLKTSTVGWSLSPAFDLNLNPEGETKRLSTAIDEDSTIASIKTTLEVAGSFGLAEQDARQVTEVIRHGELASGRAIIRAPEGRDRADGAGVRASTSGGVLTRDDR
jgi:hypothetical protein